MTTEQRENMVAAREAEALVAQIELTPAQHLAMNILKITEDRDEFAAKVFNSALKAKLDGLLKTTIVNRHTADRLGEEKAVAKMDEKIRILADCKDSL